jgi:hypothetical protein
MSKQLRSDIKAFCIELMNETSTSGAAGSYLTKNAFRKPTKKDLKSPTGYETSVQPNMYAKKWKYKYTSPSRKNSKDLWEIKVLKPGAFKTNLTYGDKNPILVWKRNTKYSDNRREIDLSLEKQGYDTSWDRNETTWSLVSFEDEDHKMWWADDEIQWDNKLNEDKTIKCKCGWSWKFSEGGDDPYTCHKCWNVNESKQDIHSARKEAHMKLDEIRIMSPLNITFEKHNPGTNSGRLYVGDKFISTYSYLINGRIEIDVYDFTQIDEKYQKLFTKILDGYILNKPFTIKK